jgi:hypothetical protein
MWEALKGLVKQPYWVIAQVIGAALILLPCVTVEKGEKANTWTPHTPSTWVPVAAGLVLLVVSVGAFVYSLIREHAIKQIGDSSRQTLTNSLSCCRHKS